MKENRCCRGKNDGIDDGKETSNKGDEQENKLYDAIPALVREVILRSVILFRLFVSDNRFLYQIHPLRVLWHW